MNTFHSLRLILLSGLIWLLSPTIGLASSISSSTPKIYHKGWMDLNKNGQKDIYEDSSLINKEYKH